MTAGRPAEAPDRDAPPPAQSRLETSDPRPAELRPDSATPTPAGTPTPAQLRLDNQLCFLFHRISRDLTAAYRPLLADLGLTYPQYLVMLVLWEQDGLGVGEIGERLCLDSGTLSPLLRRMESAGLLRRSRESGDERRVTVSLTDVGAGLRNRAVDVPQALAGRLVDDMDTYRALKVQLAALARRLEASALA